MFTNNHAWSYTNIIHMFRVVEITLLQNSKLTISLLILLLWPIRTVVLLLPQDAMAKCNIPEWELKNLKRKEHTVYFCCIVLKLPEVYLFWLRSWLLLNSQARNILAHSSLPNKRVNRSWVGGWVCCNTSLLAAPGIWTKWSSRT